VLCRKSTQQTAKAELWRAFRSERHWLIKLLSSPSPKQLRKAVRVVSCGELGTLLHFEEGIDFDNLASKADLFGKDWANMGTHEMLWSF